MDYSKTVNLLKTDFPMRGELPKREPHLLEKWSKMGLYQKIQEKTKDKKTFLLHDGPPYANGSIHMGHALNKTLKDFVVKYKNLAGFRSPYKPGWDCHGLPIEHALFKQLKKNKHQVPQLEFRQKATDYALSFVDKQKQDFIRLGILGEWDNPYLTLEKNYEAGIVETFFGLRDRGAIYRGLKPGYWCAYDETALAEAEVEYADKKSDSVFVRFKVTTKSSSPNVSVGDPLFILIWTTTPWTLPANVGLAFHPDEKYTTITDGKATYIVAVKLADKVIKTLDSGFRRNDETFSGKDAVGMAAVNPLNGKESKAVTATYVTMEDGTGIVHIAPGHGVDDFHVGMKWKLDVVCPVNEKGKYDDSVAPVSLLDKHVLKDANKAVMDILGENLVHHHVITHSFPHCWRCKNPIIFRATEQWFLKVDDDFRKTLLNQIDKVRWEPDYGIHRIKGMVEQRPDWCLSRQRHWGTPIMVFHCTTCKEILNDKNVNASLLALIKSEGTDAWYKNDAKTLLKGKPVSCAACKGTEFEKESDILDVWFDSGVSWHSVVEQNFGKPDTVMYLEGSDQHRGWFQTSLIPSTALKNKAPYDIVLTHGFVVDGKGKKMSKSVGNVIAPQEIIKQYGADILRLWVAASDYREDVRLSNDIVKHVVDMYRRFRNTFRFLLQNTSDFTYEKNKVPFEKMEEIDRWILVHFEDFKSRVLKAYEAYEFHVVLSELNRFAAVPLSGFYLDALKDRLYCEALNSPQRRSAQTAFYSLTRGLSVLLAPLLAFTAEEAYLELRRLSNEMLSESVFLDEIQKLPSVPFDKGLNEKWVKILEIRKSVNDVLDKQRKAGVLKTSQQASVHINTEKLKLDQKEEDWPFILQMSEVHFNGKDKTSDPVTIEATKNKKCERCWRHRADVGTNGDHPTLCARCADVVVNKKYE